jgi:diacylglycerol kinase family enzyme
VRTLLIVNPYASRVTMEHVEQIRHTLPGNVEVVLTEHRGHATELARERVEPGIDALYVFSGDGGFNEVLNGVDGSVPIGFLPGGSTSVLSRALGLPRDPIRAAEQIAQGRVRRISVGVANGRRFGFSAGVGFDAEVVRRVDLLGRRPDGKRGGDVAFLWATAKTLAARRARYDEALSIEGYGRAAFALIANCDPYSYAAALPLHVAPEAHFELGLDLVAPRRVRGRDVVRLASYAVRGRGQTRASDILYAHDLDVLRIHCDAPTPLQVDGEDLGDVTDLLVECERDAVSVLV